MVLSSTLDSDFRSGTLLNLKTGMYNFDFDFDFEISFLIVMLSLAWICDSVFNHHCENTSK